MVGVETNTLFADRWILSEFESDMMGQPYVGRGISGYDPAKKAYVSVFADTMATSLTVEEATYDAEANTMTGSMEMDDPMMGKTKAKTVAEWPDADSRTVKMYVPADAPEPFMIMSYKRRKAAEPEKPAEEAAKAEPEAKAAPEKPTAK